MTTAELLVPGLLAINVAQMTFFGGAVVRTIRQHGQRLTRMETCHLRQFPDDYTNLKIGE